MPDFAPTVRMLGAVYTNALTGVMGDSETTDGYRLSRDKATTLRFLALLVSFLLKLLADAPRC